MRFVRMATLCCEVYQGSEATENVCVYGSFLAGVWLDRPMASTFEPDVTFDALRLISEPCFSLVTRYLRFVVW